MSEGSIVLFFALYLLSAFACRILSEFSSGQFPVYDLYLFPYYAIIILQNLYESEHARRLGR